MRLRGSRKTLVVLTVFVAFASVLIIGLPATTPRAWAHCSGSSTFEQVGGKQANTHRGTQGNVLINDFQDPHQFNTWRHVAVFQNDDNFAEAGWQDREALSNGAHPFKTWASNGQLGSDTLEGVNLDRGVRLEFKVHDQNGDNFWSFAYEGQAMGNEQVANLDNGTSLSAAETTCTADTLFAEFRAMAKCHGQGCDWTAWNSMTKWKDTSPDYVFCKLTERSFDVRGSC